MTVAALDWRPGAEEQLLLDAVLGASPVGAAMRRWQDVVPFEHLDNASAELIPLLASREKPQAGPA